MKKSYLTLLAIIATLSVTACGTNNNSSSTSKTSQPEQSEHITSSEEQTTSETSEENKLTSSSNLETSEDNTPETTVAIDLKNIENLKPGTNLDQQDTPEKQSAIIHHFNSYEEGLLSYFTIKNDSKVTVNANTNKKDENPINYITIGSGKSSGQIDFFFTKAIKSISISALSYYKTYKTYEGDPNNGISFDQNVKLNLIVKDENLKTIDLPSNDGQVPPIETLNFKFATPTTTFGLANMGAGSRLYLDSMVLTF